MEKYFKYDGVMPGFKNLFTFYIILKIVENDGIFLEKNHQGLIVNLDYIQEKADLYLPGVDFTQLISFLDQIDINYNRREGIQLGLIDLFDYHIKTFGYPKPTNWDVNLHHNLRSKILLEFEVINQSTKWVPFFRDHTLNQLLTPEKI